MLDYVTLRVIYDMMIYYIMYYNTIYHKRRAGEAQDRRLRRLHEEEGGEVQGAVGGARPEEEG